MTEFEGITSKDEFIKQIAHRNNYNQGDCKKVVDTMIEILHDCIVNREEFSVRGFGQLQYSVTEGHEGNKPTRGQKGVTEKIWIPETKKVKFVLSTDLRNLMKKEDEE